MNASSSETAPTYTVMATYDHDYEAWWCDEPWSDTASSDITGGTVVGKVPLDLWLEHRAAVEVMTRTRLALSDALGLHPTEMMLAEVCDAYEGTNRTIGTWHGWDDCDACGWPHADHQP